jgi:8-oxo-dGTP pyrophosphatase MutT (NUDIX family)
MAQSKGRNEDPTTSPKGGPNSQDPNLRPTKIDEAAGGAVVGYFDATPHVVLIRTERDSISRWSLPKGHFKKRETHEEAAVREVREETGLRVEVLAPLGTIDYWFTEGKFKYHKFVHYFAMRTTGGRFEDHDDEVEEARWFPWDDALSVMAYESERALVARTKEQVLKLLDRAR